VGTFYLRHLVEPLLHGVQHGLVLAAFVRRCSPVVQSDFNAQVEQPSAP
jgi:hypothetical protein